MIAPTADSWRKRYTMLNINFRKNLSVEQSEEFDSAINFVQANMENTLRLNSIDKLEKKIDNKSGKYTVQEVEVFKAQKQALEDEVAECKIEMAQLVDDYNVVKANLVEAIQNSKESLVEDNSDEVADNFLRVIASANNHKLEKLALANLGTVEMYNNFVICHELEATTENGRMTLGKAQKDAYKQAEVEVQKALRLALSIPENDYTEKYNISFNKTDMRLLHETFVKGFRNKYEFSKDADGKPTNDFSYAGIEISYAISRRKAKDSDEYTYNFEKFNEVVARLAIGKIAAKVAVTQQENTAA